MTQTKMNKAPWSSGQDASLSRWNQGVRFPSESLKEARYLTSLFLCFEKSFSKLKVGDIMQVTYIDHSGFMVESGSLLLHF